MSTGNVVGRLAAWAASGPLLKLNYTSSGSWRSLSLLELRRDNVSARASNHHDRVGDRLCAHVQNSHVLDGIIVFFREGCRYKNGRLPPRHARDKLGYSEPV